MLCEREIAFRFITNFYRSEISLDAMDGGVEREIFGRHTLMFKEEQWPQKHLFSSFLFAFAVNIKQAMKKKKKYKNRILFPVNFSNFLEGLCVGNVEKRLEQLHSETHHPVRLITANSPLPTCKVCCLQNTSLHSSSPNFEPKWCEKYNKCLPTIKQHKIGIEQTPIISLS